MRNQHSTLCLRRSTAIPLTSHARFPPAFPNAKHWPRVFARPRLLHLSLPRGRVFLFGVLTQ